MPQQMANNNANNPQGFHTNYEIPKLSTSNNPKRVNYTATTNPKQKRPKNPKAIPTTQTSSPKSIAVENMKITPKPGGTFFKKTRIYSDIFYQI